ncbi:MAG: sigma-70 family RNA polymerase sigma factor [Actinomycetota bacterium]
MVDRAAAPASDVELVQRVATGDRRALDELYQRHAYWLTARLGRRCADDDLVDTAIQETFLDVWKQAGKYRPTGEVGAWIWTIGIRRLIDQLRKRRPPTPVPDAEVFRAVLTEEIPLALGDTPVGAAFGRLGPELQAVLAAVAFCGLTNRETARLLDLPVGTVKSRLARARRMMQEDAMMREEP